MRRTVLLAAAALLLCPPAVRAQDSEDQEGCKDSPLLHRFPGAHINACDTKDYDEAEMPFSIDESKDVVRKHLEGKVQHVSYTVPENVSELQLMRNFENALRKAGAKILVGASDTSGHDLISAVFEKGAKTFLSIEISAGSSIVTIVTPKEMEQQVETGASSLLDELNKSGHVAVYGITFDTGKATITDASAPVLGQVAELLQQNAELKLRVEGHTDNVGKAKANLELSRKRAAAVRDWLVQKGISAKRLTADGFGDRKPVADNGSEDGRKKNRRVELVKLP